MGVSGGDFHIRPLDPAEAPLAASALSEWMTQAFSGTLPQAVVNAFTLERSQKRLSAPALTLSAWADRAVGPELVGLGQAEGCEITMLYTAPEHQGTGVGKAIFDRLLDAIANDGHEQAELVVLVINEGARRFYERQGGQILQDDTVHLAGHDLPHIRYVFPITPAHRKTADPGGSTVFE